MAGALIEFPNLPGREPVRLIGYLARPDTGLSALTREPSGNTAPYPAVVLLHGCGGISSHSAEIADRLGASGYVALAVDTLGSRGMERGCRSDTFQDQAFDAYAAFRYLSALDAVDPARVALLGQSMGGSAVLYALDRDLAAQYFKQMFRAGIAYYPRCAVVSSAPMMTAPVLILIGDADQLNAAEACQGLKTRALPERLDRSDPLPGCPTRVRRRPTEARPQLNRALGARIRRGDGAGRGGEDPRISYRPPRGASGSANEATMTIRP
jgi:dienelactone hydrolase